MECLKVGRNFSERESGSSISLTQVDHNTFKPELVYWRLSSSQYKIETLVQICIFNDIINFTNSKRTFLMDLMQLNLDLFESNKNYFSTFSEWYSCNITFI